VGRKTHVRSKLQIAGPSNNVLAVGVIEMSVENLLGEGQCRCSLDKRVSSARAYKGDTRRTFCERWPDCLQCAGSLIYASFSSKDMGTLVSAIRGVVVVLPAASCRWAARRAVADVFESLNIVTGGG
jgi:hypothetical protein